MKFIRLRLKLCDYLALKCDFNFKLRIKRAKTLTNDNNEMTPKKSIRDFSLRS